MYPNNISKNVKCKKILRLNITDEIPRDIKCQKLSFIKEFPANIRFCNFKPNKKITVFFYIQIQLIVFVRTQETG